MHTYSRTYSHGIPQLGTLNIPTVALQQGKVFNRVAATRPPSLRPASESSGSASSEPCLFLLTLPPELLAKVVAHLGSAALFADPAIRVITASAARRAAKALSHTAQTSKLLKEVVDTDDSWKGLYMHYLEKRLRKEVRQLLTNLIADKEAPILGKHPTLKQWLDELDDGKCQHKEIRAKVTQLFPVGKGPERVAKAQRCAEQGPSRLARRCR